MSELELQYQAATSGAISPEVASLCQLLECVGSQARDCARFLDDLGTMRCGEFTQTECQAIRERVSNMRRSLSGLMELTLDLEFFR